MVIILDRKITPEEFEQAREIYNDYIKQLLIMKETFWLWDENFRNKLKELTEKYLMI